MKKLYYLSVFLIIATLLIGYRLIVPQATTVTLQSPTATLRYILPREWRVDPAVTSGAALDGISQILFRINENMGSPDVTFRFLDNPNNFSAQYWAEQAALEAELQRSPKQVVFDKNEYWMLSTADGPGLPETKLYRTIGNRVLEIAIQPAYVIGVSPYLTINILQFIESITITK